MATRLLLWVVLALSLITKPGVMLQIRHSSQHSLFVATNGSDANDGTAEHPFRTIQYGVDRARAGDTVTIRGGTYSEAVHLTHSGDYFGRPITIQAMAGETVILDGTGIEVHDALFNTAGQDHLIVRRLSVRNTKYQGIAVVGSYRVRIENCSTAETGGSGILVDKGNDVTVSKCNVTKACSRGGEESVSIKRSANVVFEDSEVHDSFHEGIDVKEGSRHIVVRRNRVYGIERQGLYADAWDADTGDIRFENNVIHDCLVGLVACTETGGLLHDVDFVGNLVYDCRGPGMMLAKWGGQGYTHRIQRVAYLNNTVVNCGGPSKSGGIWGGGMLLENDQAEGVRVINNVLSGNPYAQFRISLGLIPKGVNARANLVDGAGLNITQGNLVRHARFVDAHNKDFRLAKGSPGIDAGVLVAGVGETDVSGNPRVQGTRIDIGAYER